MAGEGRRRAEAADARGLAHELGRGQRPAALERQQRRREGGDQAGELALQAVDASRQLPDAADQLGGDAGDGARTPGEARPRAPPRT